MISDPAVEVEFVEVVTVFIDVEPSAAVLVEECEINLLDDDFPPAVHLVEWETKRATR